jgi:hypothetical protein
MDAMTRMALARKDAGQAVRDAIELSELAPARWKELSIAARFIAAALVIDPRMEGAADQAIGMLEKAIVLGYPEVPELATDPIWQPLRSRPGFSSLKEREPAAPDVAPSAFVFDYPHDDPGPRFWRREGEVWRETQPSGKVNEFRIDRRLRVRGISGTEIVRVDEENLHLFIPDKDAEGIPKLLMKTGDGSWQELTPLRDVK